MARTIRTDRAEADLIEILVYLRKHNPRPQTALNPSSKNDAVASPNFP